MRIVELGEVTAGPRGVAGGKAAGLGELIRAGERVPAGFCLTAEAGALPPDEILAAYERLGGGAVAVRSSATVEDAPDASFAGMFDTVLDVEGPEALLAAIGTCLASAGNARAAAYEGPAHEESAPEATAHEESAPEAAAHEESAPEPTAHERAAPETTALERAVAEDGRMAVVVQRMVAAETAGVLFTADPVSGCRTTMLVESAAGGGSAVVDGKRAVDRRVLDRADPLWVVGERLQALFGSPQDVEWAVDHDGVLWILQSRPITTLFPAPPDSDGPLRVYLEFGHVQGMLRPVTPMGLSTLKDLVKAMLAPLGLRVEITDIGGRLYGDVTIEMDLALWQVARRAAALGLPASGLAAHAEEIGLDDFLRAYGHRGVAEVDLGVPRWSEDPAPVLAALATMLQVTDPEQAPDRRFARAAESAEASLRELGVRVRRRRPVRGSLALFLLRRARELAGLREAGKFAGLHRLAEMRRHLLAAGADLAAAGVLERPGDIMFLTLDEASTSPSKNLVAARRAVHERECRRRSVPVALLSDGTDVEAVLPSRPDPAALIGVGASAGRATGRVRVVLDPATAHLEPGEVLVTPTTDPGWTPLFLTAAALVTETGAVMAHGPTVAREYGIPAVICVLGATRHLRTGQVVTVDAAAGTVTVLEGP